ALPHEARRFYRFLCQKESAERASAVAQNPNLPVDSLFQLGYFFPEDFWRNPLIPLLLLEKPDLFLTLSFDLGGALLTAPTIPEDCLTLAAQSKEEKIKILVAKNPKTPRRALQRLYEESCAKKNMNSDIKDELALNPATPEDVLLSLAEEIVAFA